MCHGDNKRMARIENMVTLAATVSLTLGLYALGAGGWSFVGLVCLLNMNT